MRLAVRRCAYRLELETLEAKHALVGEFNVSYLIMFVVVEA